VRVKPASLYRDAISRTEQVKYEHDRAVNRVCFGGQSGTWLISAAQDGLCRLWDVRTDSVSATAMMTQSDPARDVLFHPTTTMPHVYSLCTVHESGALLRWDLRHSKVPTERIQAHQGGTLCIAWKAASARSAFGEHQIDDVDSWIATGGQDRMIKIWKVGASGLSMKPVHTLYASQPVQRIAWRPGFGAELASVGAPLIGQGEEAEARVGCAEVEIWDVRRPHVAKWSMRHPLDGPATSLVFPDATTMWTTHRSTAAFIQHDIDHDAVRRDEDLPRCASGWNIEGELAFAVTRRQADFAENRDAPPADVGGLPFPIDQELASIASAELDFDGAVFRRLAERYLIDDRPFEELCAVNADVAEANDRLDAAQTWRILSRWFGAGGEQDEGADENAPTAPPSPSRSQPSPNTARILSGGRRSAKSSFSPTPSPGRPLAQPPSRLGLISQTFSGSASISEASSLRDGEESSSSVDAAQTRVASHSSRPSERPPPSSSDNSESESGDMEDHSPFGVVGPLQSNFAPRGPPLTGHSRNSSRSSTVTTPRANRPALLPLVDPAPMHRSTSTSSDSEAEGPYGSVRTAVHLLKHRRAVSEGPGVLSTLTRPSPSSRAGRSRTRRGTELALSKVSANGEATARLASSRSKEARSTMAPTPVKDEQWDVVRAELKAKLESGLREVLERYAEQVRSRPPCWSISASRHAKGDVQMCATVIAVMKGKMDVDPAFRSRATTAYLRARPSRLQGRHVLTTGRAASPLRALCHGRSVQALLG
jgi:WD40 repeat protein